MGAFLAKFFGTDTGLRLAAQPRETHLRADERSGNEHGTCEVATFGGGCFWCIDEVFRQLRGVLRVESGYAGGAAPAPSYRDVCGGATGHAEVVQVTFNPTAISFRDLLEVFFTVHDPTTLNRQGSDVGTQYRSVILFQTDEQRVAAEQFITELTAARTWDRAIVTELAPFTTFYKAEASHQEYFSRNPRQQYCQIVIAPKVAKFRKRHTDKLRA